MQRSLSHGQWSCIITNTNVAITHLDPIENKKISNQATEFFVKKSKVTSFPEEKEETKEASTTAIEQGSECVLLTTPTKTDLNNSDQTASDSISNSDISKCGSSEPSKLECKDKLDNVEKSLEANTLCVPNIQKNVCSENLTHIRSQLDVNIQVEAADSLPPKSSDNNVKSSKSPSDNFGDSEQPRLKTQTISASSDDKHLVTSLEVTPKAVINIASNTETISESKSSIPPTEINELSSNTDLVREKVLNDNRNSGEDEQLQNVSTKSEKNYSTPEAKEFSGPKHLIVPDNISSELSADVKLKKYDANTREKISEGASGNISTKVEKSQPSNTTCDTTSDSSTIITNSSSCLTVNETNVPLTSSFGKGLEISEMQPEQPKAQKDENSIKSELIDATSSSISKLSAVDDTSDKCNDKNIDIHSSDDLPSTEETNYKKESTTDPNTQKDDHSIKSELVVATPTSISKLSAAKDSTDENSDNDLEIDTSNDVQSSTVEANDKNDSTNDLNSQKDENSTINSELVAEKPTSMSNISTEDNSMSNHKDSKINSNNDDDDQSLIEESNLLAAKKDFATDPEYKSPASVPSSPCKIHDCLAIEEKDEVVETKEEETSQGSLQNLDSNENNNNLLLDSAESSSSTTNVSSISNTLSVSSSLTSKICSSIVSQSLPNTNQTSDQKVETKSTNKDIETRKNTIMIPDVLSIPVDETTKVYTVS